MCDVLPDSKGCAALKEMNGEGTAEATAEATAAS
jgi:hypothetical protein